MSGRGRPSLYTEEIADEICRRLEAGESLNAICGDAHMPSERTVRDWDREDRNGFSPKYASAREAGYLKLADELIDIADNGSNDWMKRQRDDGSTELVLDHEHVTRSRLRVDTRKWVLSKMLPKVFGEHLQIDANVRASVITAEPLSEDEWQAQHTKAKE